MKALIEKEFYASEYLPPTHKEIVITKLLYVVFHENLYNEKIKPKFAKRYCELATDIVQAVQSYKNDVINCKFPTNEHSFSMDKLEFERLKKEIG